MSLYLYYYESQIGNFGVKLYIVYNKYSDLRPQTLLLQDFHTLSSEIICKEVQLVLYFILKDELCSLSHFDYSFTTITPFTHGSYISCF